MNRTFWPSVALFAALAACQVGLDDSDIDSIEQHWGGDPRNGAGVDTVMKSALLYWAPARAKLQTLSWTELKQDPDFLFAYTNDVNTKVLTTKLVACAFDASYYELLTDLNGFSDYVYGGMNKTPGWMVHALSQAEAESLWSCAIARVNILGYEVHVSGTGQAVQSDGVSSTPIPLQTPMPVQRTKNGQTVFSTQPCELARGGGGFDLNQNCGWGLNGIGRTLNTTGLVTAAVGKACKGTTFVRICKGIEACDSGTPDVIGAAALTCSHRTISFSPSSIPNGVFSVLVAGTNPVSVGPSASVGYPANERDVDQKFSTFLWPEATYYGNGISGAVDLSMDWFQDTGGVHWFLNLTNPDAVKCEQPNPVCPGGCCRQVLYPNRDSFRCSSPLWSQEAAILEKRVCGGPLDLYFGGQLIHVDDHCGAKDAGYCSARVTGDPYACNAYNTSTGTWGDCMGPGSNHTWQHVESINTLGKCELLPPADQGLCGL